MSVKSAVNDFVGVTTNISVLLREMAVVAIFCLLFFSPSLFQALLSRVGISNLSTPFGNIDVKAVGNNMSTVNRGLSDSVLALQQMQGAVRDPNEKKNLGDVTNVLLGLEQPAQAADASIKSEVLNQQAALGKSSPQAAKAAGWLFAGHVDDSKAHWSGEGAKNVPANLAPSLAVGTQFNVTSTVYLHDSVESGNHAAGSIVGVVQNNGLVKVIEAPQFSHALAGGYFCWVNVQPE